MNMMITYLQFEKIPLKKGPWSLEEDHKLIAYINRYGIWNWNEMPKAAGLSRTGKSCRLRWMNYLRPGLKHGNFTQEEEETIIRLHQMLGNRWSVIASKLPGRTDNEIKNHWHSHLKKRLKNHNFPVQQKDEETSENVVSWNSELHSNAFLIPSPESDSSSSDVFSELDFQTEFQFLQEQSLETDQMWVDEEGINPYLSSGNIYNDQITEEEDINLSKLLEELQSSPHYNMDDIWEAANQLNDFWSYADQIMEEN